MQPCSSTRPHPVITGTGRPPIPTIGPVANIRQNVAVYQMLYRTSNSHPPSWAPTASCNSETSIQSISSQKTGVCRRRRQPHLHLPRARSYVRYGPTGQMVVPAASSGQNDSTDGESARIMFPIGDIPVLGQASFPPRKGPPHPLRVLIFHPSRLHRRRLLKPPHLARDGQETPPIIESMRHRGGRLQTSPDDVGAEKDEQARRG